MRSVASIVGFILIAAALLDVYLTVLFARSGIGMSPFLERLVWKIFRGVAQGMRRFRDPILAHAGPVMLVLVALTWGLLLLMGFGLLFWSQLNDGLKMEGPEAAKPTFNTALIYSGYNLTNLGASSMTPQKPLVHWLSVMEAACGFTLFTLTLTYILQVSTAVLRKNHLALKLHHSATETSDAAEMVARLGQGGDFSEARNELSMLSADLLQFFESHHFYPTINYFRFSEVSYATARMSLLAMDIPSLIRTGLVPESSGHLHRAQPTLELYTAGMHFLSETSQTFLPKRFRRKPDDEPKPEEVELWRRRYERALDRLEQEGIEVNPDRAGGAEQYIQLRREWDRLVKSFAEYLLHEWKEVAPHEEGLLQAAVPAPGAARGFAEEVEEVRPKDRSGRRFDGW